MRQDISSCSEGRILMDLGWLDWIIIGFLVFIIFMILIGKGQQALSLMNGKRWSEKMNDPNYDPKKEERATLIFSIVLLAAVIADKFVTPYWSYMPFVTIGVAVLSVVGYLVYMRK